MPTTFRAAITNYLRSANPARSTLAEYLTTFRKWNHWGGGVPIEKLGRTELRDFFQSAATGALHLPCSSTTASTRGRFGEPRRIRPLTGAK